MRNEPTMKTITELPRTIVNRIKSDRGDALITTAVTLIALLALVALSVDVGMAYSERRKMQNAADAGALAGAWVLIDGGTDAEVFSAIQEYTVGQNEADSFEAVYLPSEQPVGDGFVPADSIGVRVTARVTVPTFIAGLVGVDTMSASGEAGGGFSPVDIVLVMDRSGSMDDDSCSLGPNLEPCAGYVTQGTCESCGGSWYLPPQPITDAKNAAKTFVDLNNPNLAHIALASYSHDYTLDQGLTENFNQVKSAIDALNAAGCTNAAGGLLRGREELTGSRRRPDAIPIIVFLTDGLPNKGLTSADSCGGCPDYCPVAKDAARNQATLAAQDHIVIYTIALGDKADQGLMQDIADITGGMSYYAPTSADLDAIYQSIFDQIRLRLIE